MDNNDQRDWDYTIEIKLRYNNDQRGWDDMPVAYTQLIANKKDISEALCYCVKMSKLWHMGQDLIELRWNYIGSFQGHYVVDCPCSEN